jgi:hypothetical protein
VTHQRERKIEWLELLPPRTVLVVDGFDGLWWMYREMAALVENPPMTIELAKTILDVDERITAMPHIGAVAIITSMKDAMSFVQKMREQYAHILRIGISTIIENDHRFLQNGGQHLSSRERLIREMRDLLRIRLATTP